MSNEEIRRYNKQMLTVSIIAVVVAILVGLAGIIVMIHTSNQYTVLINILDPTPPLTTEPPTTEPPTTEPPTTEPPTTEPPTTQPPATQPQTTPTRVGTVTVRYIANGMYISNDSIQNANVYSGGYVNVGGVYTASYVTINANLYSDGYVRFRHPPIEPEGKALRFVAWLRNTNPNNRSYPSNLVTIYWGNSTEDSEIIFYPYMVHDPSR